MKTTLIRLLVLPALCVSLSAAAQPDTAAAPGPPAAPAQEAPPVRRHIIGGIPFFAPNQWGMWLSYEQRLGEGPVTVGARVYYQRKRWPGPDNNSGDKHDEVALSPVVRRYFGKQAPRGAYLEGAASVYYSLERYYDDHRLKRFGFNPEAGAGYQFLLLNRRLALDVGLRYRFATWTLSPRGRHSLNTNLLPTLKLGWAF